MRRFFNENIRTSDYKVYEDTDFESILQGKYTYFLYDEEAASFGGITNFTHVVIKGVRIA